MKRFLFILSFFLLIPLAGADTAQRATIVSLDVGNHNAVITLPDDTQQWLIHYRNGCDTLREDSANIQLITQGNLNGYGDFLKLDAYHTCQVNQAKEINARFRVESTFTSGDETVLQDESGGRFSVHHLERCRPFRAFLHDWVYADIDPVRGLNVGDRVYFPRNAGVCIVRAVQRAQERPSLNVGSSAGSSLNTGTNGGYHRPGQIHDLKATPGDRSVDLSWRVARPNEDVAYYWVSHSRFPVQTKKLDLNEMPDREKADTNFFTVTGLDNNRQYYFYVLPVGRNGNPADDWSNAAYATPNAAAIRPAITPEGNRALNLRLYNESSRSFLFRWDTVRRATKYFVALEIDGRRDFAFFDRDRVHVRVLKKAHRQGRSLRLVVKASNVYGLLEEAFYDFRF